MQQILSKLFSTKPDKVVKAILECYKTNHFCIVHFLYFAQVVAQELFLTQDSVNENGKKLSHYYKTRYPESKHLLQEDLQDMKFDDYKQSLLDADFLLPDGIALQLFYFVARLRKVIRKDPEGKKYPLWLRNLNGTDFVPYFLEEVKRQYGNQKICLLLYGAHPKTISTAQEFLNYKGYNVIYTQHGYESFDWKKAQEACNQYEDTINILIVGRSTSQLPLQELWTQKHQFKIKKTNLLVFTVGWFFDFAAGVQKRAPKVIRWIKLEWLRRLLSDPKRNFKKNLYTLSVFKYIFYYLLLKKR